MSLTKPNLPAQAITLNQMQKSSVQFQGELDRDLENAMVLRPYRYVYDEDV